MFHLIFDEVIFHINKCQDILLEGKQRTSKFQKISKGFKRLQQSSRPKSSLFLLDFAICRLTKAKDEFILKEDVNNFRPLHQEQKQARFSYNICDTFSVQET